MPCSKYSGRQRKACYATDEWKRPVRKAAARKAPKRKPKTAKRKR